MKIISLILTAFLMSLSSDIYSCDKYLYSYQWVKGKEPPPQFLKIVDMDGQDLPRRVRDQLVQTPYKAYLFALQKRMENDEGWQAMVDKKKLSADAFIDLVFEIPTATLDAIKLGVKFLLKGLLSDNQNYDSKIIGSLLDKHHESALKDANVYIKTVESCN